MIITQHYINSTYGENMILDVNPNTIFFHVGPNRFLTKRYEQILYRYRTPLNKYAIGFLRKINPFIIPEILYPKPIHIRHHNKYNMIREVIENRQILQETQWYKLLLSNLDSNGYAQHRRTKMYSEEDIVAFFNHYVFDLIDSMRREGYLHDKNPDPGKAIIGSNGELHKCSAGDHRFYVARLHGIQSIPLRVVGVHKDYFDNYKLSNPNHDFFLSLENLLKNVENKHK